MIFTSLEDPQDFSDTSVRPSGRNLRRAGLPRVVPYGSLALPMRIPVSNAIRNCPVLPSRTDVTEVQHPQRGCRRQLPPSRTGAGDSIVIIASAQLITSFAAVFPRMYQALKCAAGVRRSYPRVFAKPVHSGNTREGAVLRRAMPHPPKL